MSKIFQVWWMKQKSLKAIVFFALLLSLLYVFNPAVAEKKLPEVISITLEGARLPPVAFSHTKHIEKAKIDCIVCHHKDKDPKEPEGCVKCHLLKEAKDNAPVAKDAFHKKCLTCHKDVLAKGINAPTKCNECHKK
jgi:hypothetical protein